MNALRGSTLFVVALVVGLSFGLGAPHALWCASSSDPHSRYKGPLSANELRESEEGSVDLTADEVRLLKHMMQYFKDTLVRETVRAKRRAEQCGEILESTTALLGSSEINDKAKAQAASSTSEMLVRFERYEVAIAFVDSVIQQGYESHGAYYYRAVAMLNLERPWDLSIEADLKRSLELAALPDKEMLYLKPSVWAIHLALAKHYYVTRQYGNMWGQYQSFIRVRDPLTGKSNVLAADWEDLSLAAKIRRIMDDLELVPEELNNPLETVFARVIESEPRGDRQ
ncbi:MAG: hypothetical protein ACYTAN_13215 [Planctomycetota bacterium]|jgi:hypothetical protein